MNYVGDFVDDATVYIPFNTFDSNDPSASVTITDLIQGDVEVWRNGVVQTTPGSGVTLTLNIGANNGSHLIAVDTSDTTDAGWFATGNDYQVRINGTTVDAATINAWVGSFSIQNRFMRGTDSALLAASVTIADGAIASDLTHIHGSALTETAGQLAAAFVKLFDVATPTLVASDVMVGTDSAALASVLGAAVGASISADIADIPTVAEFNARSIVSADYTIVADLGVVQSADNDTKLTTIAADVVNIDGIVPATAGDAMDLITNAVDANALAADAVTEIWAKAMVDIAQGAPSATASVLTAINYLYESWRNKTVTTDVLVTIMKDNGTTGLVKSVISDDGSEFIKGEMITGA